MDKLLIYYISSDYVKWLLQYEPNIMWAKSHKNFSRPYIGIVLEINDFLYFAPLTHKVSKWIGYQDHFVISCYGSVCFNSMIPICKQCFNDVAKNIKFKKLNNSPSLSDQQYGQLLTNEYRTLNKKWNLASAKSIAFNVYNRWANLSRKGQYCCNFKILEHYANYWKEQYCYNLLKIFVTNLLNNYIL